ncbi:MAG: hypothetical protein QW478_15415 [Candidatus Micrarchaeaceae archaeon]
MALNQYLSQVIVGVANGESNKVTITSLPQNQNLTINGIYLIEVTSTLTNNFILNIYKNLQQVVSFDYRALLVTNGSSNTRSDNYITLGLDVKAGDQVTFSVVSGSSAASALVVVDYTLAS